MASAETAIPPTMSLRGSAARRRREAIVRTVLLVAALSSIVISAFIVYTVAIEAIDFLRQIDLAWLVDLGWFPRRDMFDVLTLLLGTAMVTGIAMLIAGPIGLASAIYLSEYATPKTRRTIKPVLEILAGIPSVVLGFFALTFINPTIVQTLFEGAPPFTILAAGIAVGILSIPLVASVAEDAMRAVPASLREASYGLGARRLTTSTRVVVPAAISGIVAALILATSRAMGETMVVALAAGATGGGIRSIDPIAPGQTMTAAMAALATGSDNVVGEYAFQSLFFVGALLFVITLVLNVIGDAFVRRARQRY
ncbi:MAG TPA: phosphate ABC transporter permease subunit PstC [Candidatus Limnocylindrales bacterium]